MNEYYYCTSCGYTHEAYRHSPGYVTDTVPPTTVLKNDLSELQGKVLGCYCKPLSLWSYAMTTDKQELTTVPPTKPMLGLRLFVHKILGHCWHPDGRRHRRHVHGRFVQEWDEDVQTCCECNKTSGRGMLWV